MKTKQRGVSAVNRQIFSLSNVVKKFIQSLLCLTMLFGYSMVHASSNPANFDLNIKEKLANSTSSPLLNLNNNFSIPLVGSSENPTLSWSRQVGTQYGSANAQGVSADNKGNIYIAGSTSVGISGQKQNGISDYFIAKYDQSDNLIWTKQVGTSCGYNCGNTYAQGVSADSNGNIYVAGYTNVGISGQIQNGKYDYFIAKYDQFGNLIWTRQVGGAPKGDTEANGINADNFGNIYVTGVTTIGISGQKQNGAYDYFIAKYDQSGNLIWTKQVGDNNTYGQGVNTDNNGSIYVTGYTSGGISGQTQTGTYDYFIAKYDATGNLQWTKQVGAKGGDTRGYGISTDSEGNSFVTGYTTRGISGQTRTGNYDYFIAKYDQSSNLIWTRQVGVSGGMTFAHGVSADNYGNIYVVGYTNVGLSGQIQYGNDYNYFIVQYDQSGSLVWTRQVGVSGGKTLAEGVSADNNGNVYIAGWTTGGISGQTQTGIYDYFIAKWTN